jgi:hypothetical protein
MFGIPTSPLSSKALGLETGVEIETRASAERLACLPAVLHSLQLQVKFSHFPLVLHLLDLDSLRHFRLDMADLGQLGDGHDQNHYNESTQRNDEG